MFLIPHFRTSETYVTLETLMEDADGGEIGSAGNGVAELRKICAACENALLKLLDPETYTQTEEPRISHHEDLSSLAISSKIGCWICAAVQDEIRKGTDGDDRAHWGTYFEPWMEMLQPPGHVYRRIGLLSGWRSTDGTAVPLGRLFKDGEKSTVCIV